MATDFTTWAALRTAIKNAIATYVAGSPCTGEYSVHGLTVKYRSISELKALYKDTYELENLENSGDRGSIVSYGSYREPV